MSEIIQPQGLQPAEDLSGLGGQTANAVRSTELDRDEIERFVAIQLAQEPEMDRDVALCLARDWLADAKSGASA